MLKQTNVLGNEEIKVIHRQIENTIKIAPDICTKKELDRIVPKYKRMLNKQAFKQSELRMIRSIIETTIFIMSQVGNENYRVAAGLHNYNILLSKIESILYDKAISQ